MFETLAHLFTPRHTNNHRPRLIHPEGLFVLAALAIVFNLLLRTGAHFGPIGNVLGYSSSITVQQVLDAINQERANSGLSRLSLNRSLSTAATAKATDMFNVQYWAHTSPSGTSPWTFIKHAGYQYSVAGENLARDFADTDEMVSAWMGSPTHKDNIMNGKFTETGIAVVDGKLEGIETTLVVQMFGTPAKAAGAITPNKTTSLSEVVPSVQAAGETPQEPQVTPNPASIVPENANPAFSPLQLSKAFALAIVGLLIGVLSYDMIITEHRKTVRITGKNLAHIALFSIVAVAIILFKGGMLS